MKPEPLEALSYTLSGPEQHLVCIKVKKKDIPDNIANIKYHYTHHPTLKEAVTYLATTLKKIENGELTTKHIISEGNNIDFRKEKDAKDL